MKKIVLFSAAMAMLVAYSNQTTQTKSDTPTAAVEGRISEVLTQDIQQGLTPEAVLVGLQEGNARYVANKQHLLCHYNIVSTP